MKINKNGCTRLVIFTKSWAIKIPRFDYGWSQGLRGLLANIQESEFSPIDIRACPVKFSFPGGFLNIMPRCTPLNDAQWEAVRSSCAGQWLPIPVERNKRDSFGVYQNRIVAVDYGS